MESIKVDNVKVVDNLTAIQTRYVRLAYNKRNNMIEAVEITDDEMVFIAQYDFRAKCETLFNCWLTNLYYQGYNIVGADRFKKMLLQEGK